MYCLKTCNKLNSLYLKSTPFIGQKWAYEKVPKKLGTPPHPPHLDKIQKNGIHCSLAATTVDSLLSSIQN